MVSSLKISLDSSEQDLLRSSFHALPNLWVFQEEMRVLAVTSVLRPTFCWKKLTPAAREAHMLEGLLRTCVHEPAHATFFRMYMCDVTLASLEANNGEGFFTLLKRYIPDGNIRITGSNCMSYLHPRWTEETAKRLRQDDQGTVVQHWIAYRHKFICKSRGNDIELYAVSFLHLTILSAMGVSRPPEITFKPTSNFGVGVEEFLNK